MLDQQEQTVRGDHMSLLGGEGGARGEEGEAGFPFELAVHADQLQPEMLKVSAPEQTAEGEAAAPPPPASNGGKAAHKSMLGLVLTPNSDPKPQPRTADVC